MPRFFVSPAQSTGSTIFLTGREAHHALHVIRLRRGQRVTVLDGAGHEFLCEIQEYDRDKVNLSVAEKRSIPPPAARITLLQALPKGKIMDWIIQKATELAAFRVVPLLSERVVAKLSKKETANRTDKWQLIAVESIKQCGSPWLPQIDAPLTHQQFLTRKEKFDLPLFASLQPDATHPRAYFETFQRDHNRLPESICVWVGPEGDFSPTELEAIRATGALPITLGPNVLRSETAALYCLSVLNYELQSPRSKST